MVEWQVHTMAIPLLSLFMFVFQQEEGEEIGVRLVVLVEQFVLFLILLLVVLEFRQ